MLKYLDERINEPRLALTARHFGKTIEVCIGDYHPQKEDRYDLHREGVKRTGPPATHAALVRIHVGTPLDV